MSGLCEFYVQKCKLKNIFRYVDNTTKPTAGFLSVKYSTLLYTFTLACL